MNPENMTKLADIMFDMLEDKIANMIDRRIELEVAAVLDELPTEIDEYLRSNLDDHILDTNIVEDVSSKIQDEIMDDIANMLERNVELRVNR